MIKQYGIYEKENPREIFQIIASGDTFINDCPFIVHNGDRFPCEDFGVRELTKREIESLVLLQDNKISVDRRLSEYDTWKIENDKNEELGNDHFFVGSKKYYTINREEFKSLKEEAQRNGSTHIEYRGRTFSRFHFC